MTMTREQKIEALQAYCDSTKCENCILKGDTWSAPDYNGCLCFSLSKAEELDLALTLIGSSTSETINAVDHPSHYNSGKIEVIDYIEDQSLGFCLGNAVKYISRAGKKDPTKEVEDLKKAIWYVERRIKQIKEAV